MVILVERRWILVQLTVSGKKLVRPEDFTDETLSNFKATCRMTQTAVVTGQENECIWLSLPGGMMNDNHTTSN